MNAQNNQSSALLSAITFAVVCGWPLLVGGADTPPAPATAQDESATSAVERAPSPQTPDESPATAPTMHEEAVPPAEGTDIQERGVLPGRVAPGVNLLPIPAPTPSLTAIRNAMRVTSKSISVNLRIPPNLPVTVPVEVSVAYTSPVQFQRRVQTYNTATGLAIGYREAEGNGKPRAMTVDITMRELVPNGQTFSISKKFTITPLYDIFISELRFFMADPCDRFGKSEIRFVWFPPDSDGQFKMERFSIGRTEAKAITQFFWARTEVSTTANLMEPTVYFAEMDMSNLPSYRIRIPDRPLVPGPTTKYHFFLEKEESGPPGRPRYVGNGCEAEITYTIIRALMPFDKF